MQNIPPCFFALFLTNLICLHLSSAYNVLYQVCNSDNNYAGNSAFSTNLEQLSSSLSTEAVAKQGFYENNTIGTAPDQISGLVLCRGDVDSSICRDCLDQSFTDLSNQCPSSNEATIYYDFCLLSYSNQQFLNSTDNIAKIPNVPSTRFSGWDPSDDTVRNTFSTLVNTLLSNVSDQAAYKSRKHFGTGVINITASLPVIYGLSQCVPDFSNITCRACLEDLIYQMLKIFDGQQGGRFLGVRCNLRYDIYAFFYGNPDIQIGSISGTVLPTPRASGKGEYSTPDMASSIFHLKKKKSWNIFKFISS
ncbi:putative receptor-like protein kinase [Carex littledalei]|uniref:Putative receptor-like protein kinase n=1 Tax=Carex littledalei TaxID=544730 RepID=A0A833QXJ8_9POAL|nr:putative receptor-like protein kinase [Carex littledalei]